jgi:hypothetical protein
MHGGNIYGALDTNIQEAISGGVFELRPPSSPGGAWTTTFLHEFTNGQMPDGNLLLDESGTLYGLTEDLTGTTATGTIYRVETQ